MRHIYDMPYAEQSTGTSSFENDLIFCLNVFIVADKYDVTGLRQKVAPDFHTHLQRTWQTEAFVRCFKKLFGPDAIRLIARPLQFLRRPATPYVLRTLHHQSRDLLELARLLVYLHSA